MHRPCLRIIVLLLLFSNSSCRFLKADASFQIKVVNAAGEPLQDAAIAIGKKPMARTNAQGQASINTELPYNEAIIVEVSKSSPTLFYAPFFETVRLRRGASNSFKVQATLYSVSTEVASETPSDTAGETETSPPPKTDPQASDGQTSLAAPSPSAAPDAIPSDPASGPATILAPPEQGEGAAAFNPEAATQKAMDAMNEATPGGHLLTVYVGSGNEQVGEASVLLGNPEQGQWQEGCTTNARGRCTLMLPGDLDPDAIQLLVRAARFRSQTKEISLAHGDRIRIDLQKGESLEVFAIQKRYQSTRGLAGVKVKSSGQVLGETDRYGYFTSAMLSGEPTWKIELEATGHLPLSVRTEVNTGSSMALVQHFQTNDPPRPRCFVLPIAVTGSDSDLALWEKEIGEGIRQQILGQTPFAEADLERIGLVLRKLDVPLQKIARQGWQNNELKHEVEYLLRPQILFSPQPRLEISLIDANAEVRAATQSALPLRADAKQIRSVLRRMSNELAQQIPFEGAIVEELKNGFRINLSQARGHALKVGEGLSLWGSVMDQASHQQVWGEIGKASLASITDNQARIKIEEMKPKSVAALGQAIVLQRGAMPPSTQTTMIEIKDGSDRKPLKQANVYLQKRWLGATNDKGLLQVPNSSLQKRGSFEIIRSNYRPFEEELIPGTRQEWTFALSREAISLRINSLPTQALVKINGRVVGRTPLFQTMALPGAEAQLEVIADADYLPYSKVHALDEEGIDLSGENSIRLEKDVRREARQLAEQKRLPEAIALLEGVGEQNPLYALAQHELGDLLLNQLQDPVKAAAAYHRVTLRPEVASFSDKRFIGTHINEALALYHAGEQIAATEPKTALTYWQQAVGILDRCEPQLRFVPQDRYTQALHNLFYYRALSLHRTWALTQTGEDLLKANLAWKGYIQGTSLASPADRNYASLKKAESFFKHTESLLKDSQQALIKSERTPSEGRF